MMRIISDDVTEMTAEEVERARSTVSAVQGLDEPGWRLFIGKLPTSHDDGLLAWVLFGYREGRYGLARVVELVGDALPSSDQVADVLRDARRSFIRDAERRYELHPTLRFTGGLR